MTNSERGWLRLEWVDFGIYAPIHEFVNGIISTGRPAKAKVAHLLRNLKPIMVRIGQCFRILLQPVN
jgi:hypothetical protein